MKVTRARRAMLLVLFLFLFVILALSAPALSQGPGSGEGGMPQATAACQAPETGDKTNAPAAGSPTPPRPRTEPKAAGDRAMIGRGCEPRA